MGNTSDLGELVGAESAGQSQTGSIRSSTRADLGRSHRGLYTVVVVENNLAMQRMIETAYTQAGYNVLTTDTAEEGAAMVLSEVLKHNRVLVSLDLDLKPDADPGRVIIQEGPAAAGSMFKGLSLDDLDDLSGLEVDDGTEQGSRTAGRGYSDTGLSLITYLVNALKGTFELHESLREKYPNLVKQRPYESVADSVVGILLLTNRTDVEAIAREGVGTSSVPVLYGHKNGLFPRGQSQNNRQPTARYQPVQYLDALTKGEQATKRLVSAVQQAGLEIGYFPHDKARANAVNYLQR